MTEWGEKRANLKILMELTEEGGPPTHTTFGKSLCRKHPKAPGAEIKWEGFLKGWSLTDEGQLK